jgi:hypothetical protein
MKEDLLSEHCADRCSCKIQYKLSLRVEPFVLEIVVAPLESGLFAAIAIATGTTNTRPTSLSLAAVPVDHTLTGSAPAAPSVIEPVAVSARVDRMPGSIVQSAANMAPVFLVRAGDGSLEYFKEVVQDIVAFPVRLAPAMSSGLWAMVLEAWFQVNIFQLLFVHLWSLILPQKGLRRQ